MNIAISAILFVKIAIFFSCMQELDFLLFFRGGCHFVICELGMMFAEFI